MFTPRGVRHVHVLVDNEQGLLDEEGERRDGVQHAVEAHRPREAAGELALDLVLTVLRYRVPPLQRPPGARRALLLIICIRVSIFTLSIPFTSVELCLFPICTNFIVQDSDGAASRRRASMNRYLEWAPH